MSEKLFAVGTMTIEGITWTTVKAETKREARKLCRKYGQIISVTKI